MPVRLAVRRTAAVGVVTVVAVLAVACSADRPPASGTPQGAGSPTASGAAAAQVDPAVAALVPERVRAKGKLVVAADASYPPNEFLAADGHTITGMDADLADALARVMGLTVEMVNVGFDGIVPGLAAGRYDLGMSSLTDTKDREQVVDMVTYFRAGNSFIAKTDSGITVTGLGDLCGLTVAIEKGSSYVAEVTDQDAACRAAGKAAIVVQQYAGQPACNLAVLSGRAQVTIADSPVAAYQVQQSGGQLRLVGQPYGEAPFGIAVGKQSGLADPVLQGLRTLIATGVYGQILARWGLQQGAIAAPVLNGAGT